MKKHFRIIGSGQYDFQLQDYLERLSFDVLLKIVALNARCAQHVLRWVDEGGEVLSG
jgi:hypothetical protein